MAFSLCVCGLRLRSVGCLRLGPAFVCVSHVVVFGRGDVTRVESESGVALCCDDETGTKSEAITWKGGQSSKGTDFVISSQVMFAVRY